MQMIRQLIGLLLEADLEDQLKIRSDEIRQIADLVSRRLGFVNLRFLAKSKRPNGAHAYAVTDENGQNLVLKIQPVEELGGYEKAQRSYDQLPPGVRKHLPVIKSIMTLEDLGIRHDERLGIIVMEELERVPGRIYDMLKDQPSKSADVLSVLLSDRERFNRFIDRAIDKQDKKLLSKISDDDIIDLKLRLQKISKIQNLEDEFSPGIAIMQAAGETVSDWGKEKDIDRRQILPMLVNGIKNSINSEISKRPIRVNPVKDKISGIMVDQPGIRDLDSAIRAMISMGLTPNDLHQDNIMIRPETGELVISDLGFF